MRILIIGDSLTFYPLNIRENTYGLILKKYFKSKENVEVFIISHADNHTRAQSTFTRLIYNVNQFKPNIVVVHLGINDCAPRLFMEFDELFIRSLPIFLKMRIIGFMSKYRGFFTKKFPKVHVKINDFQRNYQKILANIKKLKASPIIINIAKPAERHITRSYNLLNNVKSYNKILSNLAEKNQCKLIDLYTLLESEPQLRSDDGIHLSKHGHKRVAKILEKEIESIVCE